MRSLLFFCVLLVAAPAAAESLSPEQAYPWLASMEDRPASRSLESVIPTPEGWARIGAEAGTLTMWLRHLPVRDDRKTVHGYDGRTIRAPAAAVIAMDVGSRDLQQCADTAIRLLSEYRWVAGTADELSWTFTSGDRTAWVDWRGGERFVIAGAKVRRQQGAARPNSHASFRSWLDLVFTYAGTRSLAREGREIQGDLQPGDVFVAPGSPGHAVVILDVAVHPDGRRAALLGQGYMPAQDLHVLDGRGVSTQTVDGVWFLLPDEPDSLVDTPSWAPFARRDARRFP